MWAEFKAGCEGSGEWLWLEGKAQWLRQNVTISPKPLSFTPAPTEALRIISCNILTGLLHWCTKDFYILNNTLHISKRRTSTPALKMSIIHLLWCKENVLSAIFFCLYIFTFPTCDWFVWGLHKILITMQVRFLWDTTSRHNRKSKRCHESLYSKSLYCIVTCLEDWNHIDMINVIYSIKMPKKSFKIQRLQN